MTTSRSSISLPFIRKATLVLFAADGGAEPTAKPTAAVAAAVGMGIAPTQAPKFVTLRQGGFAAVCHLAPVRASECAPKRWGGHAGKARAARPAGVIGSTHPFARSRRGSYRGFITVTSDSGPQSLCRPKPRYICRSNRQDTRRGPDSFCGCLESRH
jgi:hypothetical protein